MTRDILALLPYDDVKFKFVSNHYDVHLEGTCVFENQLCLFKTIDRGWNKEKDEWYELFVEIHRLNWLEKIKWIWKQWLFERCVGHHWSYSGKIRGDHFHYRRPKWLYVKLFNWYYKRNMKNDIQRI